MRGRNSGESVGQARLYADGRFPTPSGKARFVKTEHQPLAEPTTAEYPLSLLSGRLRDQWHGMSRTGTVPRLFNPEDEPLLHMSPKDMKPLGLKTGDLARVRSPRGSLVARVIGDGAFRGRVWLPMHWGNRFMNGAGANTFTPGACDPYSAQPELKHAAVAVEAAE
ncbi:MAG TPA: molybdopterin dinucleotide binding domain-containing protein, partial [Rhodocyclaceae bacterium]|nr:molybdopterin dinucleotide binding domain-containing protein [Rhodocyclaceae bacterium]